MTLRELKAEPVLSNILKHKFNKLRELNTRQAAQTVNNYDDGCLRECYTM
jgi:hypothetical protein